MESGQIDRAVAKAMDAMCRLHDEVGIEDGRRNFVLDKNFREIMPGDTLKVFHFVGKRRKKYFMYKYVECIYRRASWGAGSDALRLSNLSCCGSTFILMRRGQQEETMEIVQGFGHGPSSMPFDERPTIPPW